MEQNPPKVAKKITKKALDAAAQLIRNAIVALTRIDTGFLSEHFNIKFKMEKDGIAGAAFIGPAGRTYYPGRGDASKGTATGKVPKSGGRIPVASVARFLEFGTSRMPAKPFMRPAFNANAKRALDLITETIRGLLKELVD